VFATRLEHFANPLGQSLSLPPKKEVSRWPWTLWILVNTLQNRCVTSKDSAADRVMVDVKSVRRDVMTVQGSKSNVDVYGEVVIDGVAPSGKVQTCERNHIRWTARPYDVCLLGC
jgi:hypothetical protein